MRLGGGYRSDMVVVVGLVRLWHSGSGFRVVV